MNLKLFKPDYKGEKNKSKLDYSFFGEYVRKAGDKFIFKGGFGGNTKLKINTKKKQQLIDILEHNFQIESIIKRFKETMGSRYSSSIEDKTMLSPPLITRKVTIPLISETRRLKNIPSLLLSQSSLIRSSSFYHSNPSSLPLNLLSCDNTNSNKEEACASLSSIEQFPYLNKGNRTVANKTNRKSDTPRELKYKKILIKNNSTGRLAYNEMDDYFIKSDKEYYHDRNYLFNKYKRKFDFYQSNKEDKFEAKRLILFRKNSEGASYSLPKPSRHTINLMCLKNRKM